MPVSVNIKGLSAREAVIDGLYRAVNGLDNADKVLFDSSVTPDAVFDVIGRNNPLKGLDAINKGMYDLVAPLDTTHFLTNIRVDIKDGEEKASVTCHALSQHFRAGEGVKPDSENFLGGTLYDLVFVKDDKDGLWKWTSWIVKLVWIQGNPAVVAPA